jgi:signal transduction histidine kinase
VEALAEQRAVLLDRLVRAEEAERARVAADVHDDSVQALAVVDLRLGQLRHQLGELSPEQVETLDVLRESVARATSRLRQLLFDLEAPTEGVDLTTSLTDAAAHLFHDTAVAWRVTGDGGPDLPATSRLTAYRIAREAMLNCLKHAGAGRVEVRVDTDPGSGELVLTVADDGRGFGEEERRDRPGHLGLSGMDDRATIAGGRLEIDSSPGRGTTVRLRLPRPDGAT